MGHAYNFKHAFIGGLCEQCQTPQIEFRTFLAPFLAYATYPAQFITHLLFCDVQVHSLALEMVADGVSLDSVQLLLSLANTVYPHKISIVDVVNESLHICLKQLEQLQ